VFRKIIVAVDGQDGGLDAGALARTLAPPTAEIVVARVVPKDDGPEGVADAGGDDAGGLHRLADEQLADLIVVGSHHRGGTGRVWSADRTRATLRDAPCAVAVAPRGFADDARGTIRSIGVGYDESEAAQRALDLGRALAWDTAAELQALEVVPETNWQTPQSGAGWKAVAAGGRLAELEGVTGVVLEGDVLDHLAQFAREVDVLILGSHHHGVLSRLVLGHTVDDVTRHLTCAVIVLPHPMGQSGAGA